MDLDPYKDPKEQRDALILRIIFLIFSTVFGWTTYKINQKADTAHAQIHEMKSSIQQAGFVRLPDTRGLKNETTKTLK